MDNNEKKNENQEQVQADTGDDRMNLNDSNVDPISDLDAAVERLPNIPRNVIEKWLDEYGTVFRIWFLNEQYVYRPFDYTEYRNIRNAIRSQYADNVEEGDEVFKEELQKLCVLWPQDYATRLTTGKPKIPGGIPFLLGDYILAVSGFADGIVPDVISKNEQK